MNRVAHPNRRSPERFPKWNRVWAAAVCALLAGCQQKMAAQPSYYPLEASQFFIDGQSSRHLVPGTVPRGHLRVDTAFFTGRQPAPEGEETADQPENPPAVDDPEKIALRKQMFGNPPFIEAFPLPITPDFIEHGYHRYMIYCVVCHDPLGEGHGKIVERGYTPPPTYHSERLRNVPVGHLFAVITEGYGSMPSYGGQIPPRDRWAIAAYIRALQLSQHFPREALSPEMQREFAAATAEIPPESSPAPEPASDPAPSPDPVSSPDTVPSPDPKSAPDEEPQ